jgi:hypothetical protein
MDSKPLDPHLPPLEKVPTLFLLKAPPHLRLLNTISNLVIEDKGFLKEALKEDLVNWMKKIPRQVREVENPTFP